MKYFRAFRLVGNEAIDEYYSMATEMTVYQNNLYKKRHDEPDGDHSELEGMLEDVHQRMYEKYQMIPHLYYHAMPETGFVSTLVSEKTYKVLVKSGQVQEGTARKLELLKDGKTEMGWSIPVFKIDNPEGIKEFDKLLLRWQEIKVKLKEAGDAKSPDLPAITEEYEAFNKELKERYRMDPSGEYVFETNSVGVYLGCTEEDLKGIAAQQKKQREDLAAEMWKANSQT